MKKKLSADLRTVDMFSGKTQAEAIEAAEAMASGADNQEALRGPAKSIEEEADRYRTQAFIGQEWTSKNFPSTNESVVDASSNRTAMLSSQAVSGEKQSSPTAGKGQPLSAFRLSMKNGWLYLERLGLTKDGIAYSYAGLMFPKEDLFLLTDAIVATAREVKANL